MARLTSRASVLAALDVAGEYPPPTSAGLPTSTLSGTGQPGAPPGPKGYEIWENARRQAEFYATYAEMLETGRRPRGAGDAWVQELYPAGHWAGPAALATSYRQAAQHAALVDTRWATKLAVRAGMAYLSAGLPFGLFLLTGLLDDQTLSESVALEDLVVPFQTPDESNSTRHPVQLTYLLLAAASRSWLRDPLRQTLSGAEQRLSAHGLYPVGSTGVPLGDYLELATAMRYDDEAPGPHDIDESVSNIATRLAGLHRSQATALRVARRNRYLWRHGASPVSVIDLEQVAVSGLALRHRPWFGELSTAITTELARDDALAELPLWAMGSINTELPTITPNVTDILRGPDRAWCTEDFREPEAEVFPWRDERPGEYGQNWRGRDQWPNHLELEQGGDDPYSADT